MKDRRVKKTHNAIYSAMFQLSCEKDFRKITVKELCDKADINKSTFYLHFHDITDCRRQWLNGMVDYIFSSSKMEKGNIANVLRNPGPYITHLLDYFDENRAFYLTLYRSPYFGVYLRQFKTEATERMIANNRLDPVKDYAACACLAFLLGGLADAIFYGLERYDRPALEAVMKELLTNGYRNLFQDAPQKETPAEG